MRHFRERTGASAPRLQSVRVRIRGDARARSSAVNEPERDTEDWLWSSFRHYATGETDVVEIESQWTARKREQAGIFPTLKVLSTAETPAQAELGRGTLKSRLLE